MLLNLHTQQRAKTHVFRHPRPKMHFCLESTTFPERVGYAPKPECLLESTKGLETPENMKKNGKTGMCFRIRQMTLIRPTRKYATAPDETGISFNISHIRSRVEASKPVAYLTVTFRLNAAVGTQSLRTRH